MLTKITDKLFIDVTDISYVSLSEDEYHVGFKRKGGCLYLEKKEADALIKKLEKLKRDNSSIG